MTRSLRTVLPILVLLIARPLFAQDHTDVVRAAKAAVLATGVDVDSSECARFEVTERVAWALRADGAGLLAKPAGNNCQGYAVDIVVLGGQVIDILGAGPDGPNTAHWLVLGPVDLSRWRAPIAVADPTPAPTPEPPVPVEAHAAALDRIEGQLEALRLELAALQAAEHVEHEETRHEIKAFRDAAKNTVGKLLEYVPVILSGLGLLRK